MSNGTAENVFATLRDEFLVDARERLDIIDGLLCGRGVGAESLTTIRREVHNLKGMGASFGFPVIGMIAHRLEDYIGPCEALDPGQAADVLSFVCRMQEIVAIGHDPDETETPALIRSLPALPAAPTDAGSGPTRDADVLLVCPSQALSRIAHRELQLLGVRVSTARDAGEALETTVRNRPDLVLTSAVLKGVDGIDLARALAAMRATAAIPVALLTSFAPEHSVLRDLPEGVPVIQLDHSFCDAIAALLDEARQAAIPA